MIVCVKKFVPFSAPEEASERPTPPEILKWMKDLNDWFSVGEKVSGSLHA